MDEHLDEFVEHLRASQRDSSTLLSNLFHAEDVRVQPGRTVRLHVLKSDGNGRPQVGVLARALAEMILDYCIPRKLIASALEHYGRTNKTSRVVALEREARELFAKIGTSGEGGELLLFLLTESVLGYTQAVTKMALKTSGQVHFHGVDGIYVSCDSDRLRLHVGESKLEKGAAAAVRNAVSSIAAVLLDEGFLAAGRRDAFLLNTQLDLGDTQMEQAMLGFLDPESEHYRAPCVCAVLLAGHNAAKYPTLRDGDALPVRVRKRALELTDVLEDEARKQGVETFHIDAFLVPFPDVEKFREALLEALGLT